MKKFLISIFLALALATSAQASISNQTNKIFGSGNGVVTTFTYPFKIFNKSELQVYLIDPAGVATLKTLTTDYTVTISSSSEGGTVVFGTAPASGYQTFIKRVEPLTQSLVLASEGALPAKQIENQLDRATMVNIQNSEAISRAVLLPVTSTGSSPTFPSPVANKVIAWNAAGTDLTNVDSDVAAQAAAAASASAASGYASTASSAAGTAVTQAGNASASAIAAAASASSINFTLDTDVTLAANSDSKVASQKAIKAYVGAQIASKPDETALADYFASSTIVGWEATPTGSIWYKKIGKTVFVTFTIGGTSNATNATFTLPYACSLERHFGVLGQDNGTFLTTSSRLYLGVGSTVTVYKDFATGAWTSSGTKSIQGSFWYETT